MYPRYISSSLLAASLATLFPLTAHAATNSTGALQYFPDTFEDNPRPECHACLNDMFLTTCPSSSDDGAQFDRECICAGDGATRFNDECFDTCCAGRLGCPGRPLTEWWLQCVDDYPTPHCAVRSSALSGNTLLKQHCTDDEIQTAKDEVAKNDGSGNKNTECTSADWVDGLEDFNRDSGCGSSTNSPDGAAVALGGVKEALYTAVVATGLVAVMNI